MKSQRDRCQKKAHQVLDEKGNPTYREPSRRWKKYDKALERALQKRREQTKTFLFTVAHQLYQKYDCVGIGDYAPQGNGITPLMRRAMNNRSLIGRFKEVASWVAVKSGKTFLEFPEQGTTRTCHCCGYIVEGGIAPNIREWNCPDCQKHHIRDENAAKNGLSYILRNVTTKCESTFSQVSCSDLVLVEKRWAWCVSPSGVYCTVRG